MAVYTQVSDEDLSRFVAEYDIGEVVHFAGIAEGVENSNFLVRTTKASYILTIYEKRVAPQDLPFFVGLIEHLAANGLHCPTPIRARDGEALRKLNGRPAAIVSFLEGLWPRRITAAHCAGVGEALARLHQAQRGFEMRRLNALSLTGWRSLVAACEARADEVKPGLGAGIKAELVAIRSGSDEDISKPADILRRIIHRYANEIAGDFKPSHYRLARGLIKFWFARLLNGARVKKFGAFFRNQYTLRDKIHIVGKVRMLRSLASKGTVIIVPTHFSNLDSMLIGWVIHSLGLPPFIYGAGLNLFNIRIFAYFMNSLGDYKVDRKSTRLNSSHT